MLLKQEVVVPDLFLTLSKNANFKFIINKLFQLIIILQVQDIISKICFL